MPRTLRPPRPAPPPGKPAAPGLPASLDSLACHHERAGQGAGGAAQDHRPGWQWGRGNQRSSLAGGVVAQWRAPYSQRGRAACREVRPLPVLPRLFSSPEKPSSVQGGDAAGGRAAGSVGAALSTACRATSPPRAAAAMATSSVEPAAVCSQQATACCCVKACQQLAAALSSAGQPRAGACRAQANCLVPGGRSQPPVAG